MLSMNNKTSWLRSSRKNSVIASADSATRKRAPGGSFIWPKTIPTFDFDKIFLIDDARFAHFRVKIVALAGALAHPGEHRNAAVAFGDVVDQLHDDDGLADAGAAERADLAAFRERTDQIDDFDAGLENLNLRVLLGQSRERDDESDNAW